MQCQVLLASLLLFLRLPVTWAPESCSSAESPGGLLRSEEGVGSYTEDAAKLPSAGPSALSPTECSAELRLTVSQGLVEMQVPGPSRGADVQQGD